MTKLVAATMTELNMSRNGCNNNSGGKDLLKCWVKCVFWEFLPVTPLPPTHTHQATHPQSPNPQNWITAWLSPQSLFTKMLL